MRALSEAADFLRPETLQKIKAHLEKQQARLDARETEAFEKKMEDTTRHLLFADKCKIGDVKHVSFQKAADFIDGLADQQLIADAWRDLFDKVLGDRIRKAIGTEDQNPFDPTPLRRKLETNKPDFRQIMDAFGTYVHDAFKQVNLEDSVLKWVSIAKNALQYGSLAVPFSHTLLKEAGGPKLITDALDYLPGFDPRFSVTDGIGRVPHFVNRGYSYNTETLRNLGDLLRSEMQNPYAQVVVLYAVVTSAYSYVSAPAEAVDFEQLGQQATELDAQLNDMFSRWRSKVSETVNTETGKIDFTPGSFNRIESVTTQVTEVLTDGFKKIGDVPVLGDIIKFIFGGCTAEDLVALYGLDEAGITELAALKDDLRSHYLNFANTPTALKADLKLFSHSVEVLQRAQETIFERSDSKKRVPTIMVVSGGLLLALLLKGVFRQKSLDAARKLDVDPRPRGWRSKRAAQRDLSRERRDAGWAELTMAYHNRENPASGPNAAS
jgi:hypothetical protein